MTIDTRKDETMKTLNKMILTTTALTLSTFIITTPVQAGSCGSHAAKASHAAVTEEIPAIYDLAGEAGFTTLTAAIDAAGLQETLNGDGPFTVFAPTDAAFAKLPAETLESLLADKDALTKVLLYHVASGKVYAEDVMNMRTATTLNGEKVKVEIEDGVTINNAKVVQADVKAQNGVIHVIDTVLIPSNI